MESPSEHEIAFLLDFDGARYVFDEGYWVKIEVKRMAPTPQRPHGLSYSFTLHHPDGTRLLGFDNAHGVPAKGGKGKAVAHDHWHRTETDKGRPYAYGSALELVQDFLDAVERVLRERGVSAVMIGDKDQADAEQDEGSELDGVQE